MRHVRIRLIGSTIGMALSALGLERPKEGVVTHDHQDIKPLGPSLALLNSVEPIHGKCRPSNLPDKPYSKKSEVRGYQSNGRYHKKG